LSREPCVYILANRRQGTLYTGVTSNLAERVFRHRQGLTPGFTSRYGCNRRFCCGVALAFNSVLPCPDASTRSGRSRRRRRAVRPAPTWPSKYQQSSLGGLGELCEVHHESVNQNTDIFLPKARNVLRVEGYGPAKDRARIEERISESHWEGGNGQPSEPPDRSGSTPP
jgi:putative endonuclease